MKPIFLFDLDGTIADNGVGITRCVQYSLDSFGIYNEPLEKLFRFVGPPLDWSFREYYQMSPQDAEKAVEKYRERFRTKGVLENCIYPGIRELLEQASESCPCALATSKPEIFARQILQEHDLLRYFAVVVGATLDGSRVEKKDVIEEALVQMNQPPRSRVYMIGDRRHDVEGAKACGISSIAVKYGFAPELELEQAGADIIVSTVEELTNLLLKLGEA